MRIAAAAVIAGVAFAGARCAREQATEDVADAGTPSTPYTPSATTAPFFSLGYREAFADILYVRLRGYFGNYRGTTGDGIVSLAEAIVALDPKFYRAYDYAANAATVAEAGLDQSALLRALTLLDRGIAEFPQDWQLPLLAGQIYLQDLKTTDPQQRRAWDERGVLLVESSIRKPGAPQKAATYAAEIRTKLGEHERAAAGMKELLLTTNDAGLRRALLERLAKLEKADSSELASEILGARKEFERTWRAERPSLPPTMYVLIGPPLPRTFDLADLATGGRDLVGSEPFERLEPVE